MLKFLVYEDGQPATDWQLREAHLLGADDVGIRAQIRFEEGMITCDKSHLGAVAFALQFAVGDDAGDLMLQTCLLPERDEPYLLSLELARHRLMRIISKQEEWHLFDLDAHSPLADRIAQAKAAFVEALCNAHLPAEADRLARQALRLGLDASEELALVQANLVLQRRRETGHVSRNVLGCGIRLPDDDPRAQQALLENFDYIRIPMPWRILEPAEQEYDWQYVDAWCEWAFRNRMPIVAGPIGSFTPDVVPDWLYIWQHDYETIRDLLYEHIERLVTRYRSVVALWDVISGVHVNNNFAFNFEQLMDLTRMAVTVVKKVQPTARTLVEITQPFGEYYARNQRSIPPLMYAEMVLQSGIPFDGYGLKLVMGQPAEGGRTRDLMQLSALLDKYHSLGRSIHVSGIAVPSEPVAVQVAAEPEPHAAALEETQKHESSDGGYWREPWSDKVQADWVDAAYRVVLSKPFIESVAWLEMTDAADSELPGGGLLKADYQPRPALGRLRDLHHWLHEPV
ncbi:MAG: endo-1,4-beta-xylanase [Phycisphaeraceae bacterium]